MDRHHKCSVDALSLSDIPFWGYVYVIQNSKLVLNIRQMGRQVTVMLSESHKSYSEWEIGIWLMPFVLFHYFYRLTLC